jgi:glycosyltransferase involved in cell wall biosynthesis
MQNALIYSPSFDGHRQVYVYVIAHFLKELGFKIFIAGNTEQIMSNSFYIDRLKNDPDLRIIDTSKYTEGGANITRTEFFELQNACETDFTVFTEADNHISLFVSQIVLKKNRLRGRLIGIFLRPFYFYCQNGPLDKLKYFKHLPSRWRSDDKLFHEFFLKRFSLLNVALYIDENFVDHHYYSQWLPDVFQQYADLIVKDEKSEQRVWIEKLDNFKEKNKGRFLFLYFGSPQLRRGYDVLLKMAVENGGCFIHCGLRYNNEHYTYDINELKSSSNNIDELRSLLNKNGQLFETDQYIEDPLCIEYFFKSVSHLVLPYQNFYGSSGVMLQALSFGIPVLAPETGIIGLRIKKYKLGITYNEKNVTSLNTQFNMFKELDPKTFENNIKTYMNLQSAEQLKRVLVNTFTVTD